jgi:hypothetical protein
MAIYKIILFNIDDSVDPGKTILTYLETNSAAILAQNPQTHIEIQRTS